MEQSKEDTSFSCLGKVRLFKFTALFKILVDIFLLKNLRKEWKRKSILMSLSDAFAVIEAQDIRVAKVCVNAKTYVKMLDYIRNDLDIETKVEIIEKNNCMAYLWGAKICILNDLDNDYIVCRGENK